MKKETKEKLKEGTMKAMETTRKGTIRVMQGTRSLVESLGNKIRATMESRKKMKEGKGIYLARQELPKDAHADVRAGYYAAIQEEQKATLEIQKIRGDIAKAKLQNLLQAYTK